MAAFGWLSVVLVTTSVCVIRCQDCVYAPGELITQVKDEFDCAIMDCKNLTTNYTDYNFDGWILPDVTYINATFDNGKVVVDEEDWTITVFNISREDCGLYHCMLLLNGQYHLVRMGLNAKGPFFISRWEEYQNNTVIGLVAMGSFLVLCLFTWLLWKYHYRSDIDDDSDLGLEKSAINGYAPTIFTAAGHPRIPSYIHTQESVEELTTPEFADVTFKPTTKGDHEGVEDKIGSELRKRSPGSEKKPEFQTVWSIGGENPAFEPDKPMKRQDSAVSDVMVDSFFADRTNVEVTEL